MAKCTTVCFDSAESLDAVIKTTSVLKEAILYWSCLVLAKCVGYKKLGHTSLACPAGKKKNVFFGASLWKTFSDLDKSRLTTIYVKCLAPIACPVSFGSVLWAQIAGGSSFSPPPVWNILLKAGSSLKMKPTLLVFLELNDRFATLEHSLASLTECVDKLTKRLDTPEPMVSQLSSGCQPLVTLSSQNQGVDIVMSEGLGVVTGDETIAGVVFNPTVILKMEEILNNLLITVMSFLAKINNAGLVLPLFFSMSDKIWKVAICNVKKINNPAKQNDIIHWHKEKDNLVFIFTESKLKGKVHPWIVNKFDGVWMFTSGLEFGYMGADIVVVMNSSLARHVCKISEVPGQFLSIKLLFKNKLSVSILGLYAGTFLVVRFSQAGDINSLIAKAVNKSSFVILRSDFNEDNFCIVKTIDYVLISLNLVNTVVGRGMFGVEEYFDTDH
ncbi:hypothetical protein G9A89_016502 [Geosiphon pyriformis]|nr:hypothetical protein G9A89_016502 [Geosiphon pyriformis]